MVVSRGKVLAATCASVWTLGALAGVEVGVVNWDCSLPSDTFFGGYATRSLGPEKFRRATPFYADVLGENRIEYHRRTVEEYEREMQYAIDAGIDYFAYCWYDETVSNALAAISTPQNNLCNPHVHELTAARKLHVRSMRLRERLKLCAILVTVHPYTDGEIGRLAEAMRERYYQRALGRPLVYLFAGTGANQRLLTRLRAACRKAGAGDPYAVLMGYGRHSGEGDEGVQALSAYVDAKGGIKSFAELAAHGVACNARRAASGMSVVPHFTVGWDPRPRIDHPVPWCGYANTSYAPTATEDELVAGARNLAEWIRGNRKSCATGHVLAFAWNEWEEGGWICPSWDVQGPDVLRTDAFAKCIRLWKGL